MENANRLSTVGLTEPRRTAHRPTLLLAEDNPGVAKALRRLLGIYYEIVAVVPDGEGLIAQAQQLQPAAIVADVGLEGMDGISATIVIRQRLPAVPIVLITGNGDPSLRDAALAAGASAFLPKHAADSLIWTLQGLLHMDR